MAISIAVSGQKAASRAVTSKTLWGSLIVSAFVLFAALIASTLLGSQPLSLTRALQADSIDREILLSLRLPRALMASLAGGSLALTGVLFQALLRDSLADPYTLGVSSGASLGAVIAICLGWDTLAGFPSVVAAALLGAVIVMAIIARIATKGGLSSTSLLLAGITMASICGALILFLHTFATFLQAVTITRWLMGDLEAVNYSTLLELTLVVVPTVLISWKLARAWNLLAVGKDWASARGVAAHKLLITGYVLGSILSGAVTAHTGPIAFVGLIVPHALRLKLGADHRVLIPCSFLIGGAFLAVSDLFSRVVLAPVEIPVGVTTALIGGPIFIWMLYSRQTRGAVR